ncbi:MAG: squalene synthase HpnC [Pseudazoarcus pumilus]|nr:squalene synthase HpnC [Pseudazoarcus pumilus]
MPVDHYENFPVASLLLPKHLREPVEAIYAFARGADDVADEGNADTDTRLAQLAAYHAGVDAIEFRMPPDDDELRPMFERLERNVREFDLPLQPLRDLVSAFAQDVVKTRYADYEEVLDYCRRSANPVGRLLLHLYGVRDAVSLNRSDDICTALQLINFWQDVGIDIAKPRIYLPQDELARFGVGEDDLVQGRDSDAWRRLMAFQVQRARQRMLRGAPLARALPGRIGWELRLIVAGGLRILERIEAVRYDVFRHRPTLGRLDWPLLGWRALTQAAA